jgi:serine protease Do
VSGVVADSPASRAGLQAGDLLVELAGKKTNVRYDEQMPDFMRLATSLPIGKTVAAKALRAGKTMEFTLEPVERGELNPRQQELRQWGMTARNLSFLTAREMKRTNQLGVLVTSVRPGGPAGEAKPPLEMKDVLLQVNGTAVNNVKELIDLTAKLTKDKKETTPVIATFEHDSQQYLSVIRVGIQEMHDPGLEVSKAWLPVETHVISRDIAGELGDTSLKGFYVTQVYPGTTAQKAGLRPGDFITAVDDEKMTASGAEHEDELSTLIRQYDVGKEVKLAVIRGKEKERITVPVELERSPKLRREMKKYRNDDFEFTARDVSFFDVAEEQWKRGQEGALVEEVKSGSWAELGSLSTDDLIVEVDGQPVKGVETLREIFQKIVAEKKAFVVIKVLRGIHTAFLELEPTWKK